MKILAIQNKMGIGDTVIFLPFIKAISNKFGAPVSLLVKENSKADEFLNQTNYIDEIIYSKPYRQAKINIIKSKKTSDNDPLYKRITDLVGEWNLLLEDYNDNYKIKVDQSSTLSKLTDSLSSIIVSSPSERQYLLEELDEGKRAVRIIEVLESRIDYLIGKLEIPDKDSTSIN